MSTSSSSATTRPDFSPAAAVICSLTARRRSVGSARTFALRSDST
jgi:hypothetical protein